MEVKCHEQVSAREALADRTNSKVQVCGLCPVTSDMPAHLGAYIQLCSCTNCSEQRFRSGQLASAVCLAVYLHVFCDVVLHSRTQTECMPFFTFNGCQQYQLCAVRLNFCHNCKDDKAVPFRYEHTTGEPAVSARRRPTAASGRTEGEGHTGIPPTRRSDGHIRRLACPLSGETSTCVFEQVTGEAYRNPLLPRPSLITELAMEKSEHIGAIRQQRVITPAIAHWPLRSAARKKWGSICSAASKTHVC